MNERRRQDQIIQDAFEKGKQAMLAQIQKADAKKQEEIARQEEAAKQEEIARQEEIAKQEEIARQEADADAERQEAEAPAMR